MKRVIATAAVLTTVFLVAGCSGGSGDSTSSGSKDFEFWSFTGINQKADVEVYTKAHPDAHIKLTEVGSTAETADRKSVV